MLKKNSGISRRFGNRSRATRGADDDVAAVSSRIGDMLRNYYGEVASGDIPQRFVDLLKRLEENDWSQPKSHHGGSSSIQGWSARLDS
jgi:hypothetical protein